MGQPSHPNMLLYPPRLKCPVTCGRGIHQHPNPAEAMEEMCCLLKKQSSILDQAIQNCSNSQRKQLFRNQCCVQDGRSKQEASSLGSKSSFLLRHMANKLWKHILNMVFVIQQGSVEFLLCASAAGVNALRTQRPLRVVWF